eukprot:6204210-Pleurochrysis_carterae.AAC.2
MTLKGNAQYRETIQYINPVSGHRASAKSLRAARAAVQEVPILQQDNLIAVLPSESAMTEGVLGERPPFWLAQVEMNEDPATGVHPSSFERCPQVKRKSYEFGRRLDPIDPSDECMVSLWGVYDLKKGYPIIMRRCKHASKSSWRWGHALQDDDE